MTNTKTTRQTTTMLQSYNKNKWSYDSSETFDELNKTVWRFYITEVYQNLAAEWRILFYLEIQQIDKENRYLKPSNAEYTDMNRFTYDLWLSQMTFSKINANKDEER